MEYLDYDKYRQTADKTHMPLADMGQPGSVGLLRIFFGYAPGVGKTHAMLKAAAIAKTAGRGLLVGHVELHNSPDLESLVQELQPFYAKTQSNNKHSWKFDLDTALTTKPDLVLLDDLAYTNAAASRNRKRWQDVEELLKAGIDVWTTLNVQEIESLNESAARITGLQVHETVPDRLFQQADEVTFIDVPPDELLDRVSNGKVHVPERMAVDADEIFREPNLIALRELAMRCATDRAEQYLRGRPPTKRTLNWSRKGRLLVYLPPGVESGKFIRSAHQMASDMSAQWIIVYPEGSLRKQDSRSIEIHNRNLRLSEELGAETVKLTGDDIVQEILDYASSRDVTRILVAKDTRHRRCKFWQRSLPERLMSNSQDIDIYVIRNAEEAISRSDLPRFSITASKYARAIGFVVIATAIAAMFDWAGLTDANLVMTYLLAVVVSAVRLGRGAAILSSVAGVLLFNFFFTSPRLTFVVDNPEYIYTFAVMLVITLVVSALTARIRDQIGLSREKERRTELLYRISGRLAGIPGELQLVQAAKEELVSIFSGEIAFFLIRGGELRLASRETADLPGWSDSYVAAKWVFDHHQMAGWGTDAIPDAQALYIPLSTPNATVGVLAWKPDDSEQLLSFERRQLLKVIASQIAMALERDRLVQETQALLAQADAEKLRSSLLTTVSHDLRTPLTSIAGSASTLAEQDLDQETRRALANGITEEAERLNQLLENLLQLTRLESGSLRVNKEWQPIDEVIGSALERQKNILDERQINIDLPSDSLWVPIDGLLIEQVMQNLLANAAKYSRQGSAIDITARMTGPGVEVSIADRGIGLDPEECEMVFDKFYRGQNVKSDASRGAGLGLAITRGIILAHGGKIWAEPRTGGGAVFRFILPKTGRPPWEESLDQTIKEG
jgi:two-component system, OmpR family, sensor histidine kinase KdpD